MMPSEMRNNDEKIWEDFFAKMKKATRSVHNMQDATIQYRVHY